MIQELSTVLAGVKHEQEYMEIRDKVHRASELIILSFLSGIIIFAEHSEYWLKCQDIFLSTGILICVLIFLQLMITQTVA